jgi:regulation of enolase protein 1 (concanavalin A-like superfamily)
MSSTRRTFLEQSAGAALVAAHAPVFAAGEPAQREGGDLLSRMTWLNPPTNEYYDAGTLTARAKGKTDFWRKTFYGYITDNGHFLCLETKGEFTFQARVNGNYSQLYDQAGIMVRLDEKHWMKCGSEFFDGKRWASVVFTHDFSDWSTLDDLSQTGAVYWRVVRKKDSIEAQCSKDGEKFMTVRQGYFPAGVAVKVGVMCAAPEGQGFDAVFDQLTLERTAG